MIFKSYKYRFYPNLSQKEALDHTFGCVRFVYNNALSFSIEQYEQGNKTNFSDWNKNLTQIKKNPNFNWLKNVSSVPLQQSLRHLDKAFKSFFKSGFGYPKFKSKRSKQSACYMSNSFKWDSKSNSLSLAKMKQPLKVKWSRTFTGTPSSCYISKTKTGKYYISILVEEDVCKFPESNKTIGVDLGVKDLAICSDYVIFSNPKITKKHERKLAKEQRKLAKKVKGSNNFKKQRSKVAKVYEKISNARSDFTHKMTTKLVSENQVICLESLKVKNMVKNKRLAKCLLDANFGEIERQIQYKSDWYGRTVSKIDQWFPSSKMCSCCGALYSGKWSLSIREWTCSCGQSHDRDLNAATNIHMEGLRLLEI